MVTQGSHTSAPAGSRGAGKNYPTDEDYEEKDHEAVRGLLHPPPHHHRHLYCWSVLTQV